MRWIAKPRQDPYKWHRWYAWHPVRCHDAWVWFGYVERRRRMSAVGAGDIDFWKYREMGQ